MSKPKEKLTIQKCIDHIHAKKGNGCHNCRFIRCGWCGISELYKEKKKAKPKRNILPDTIKQKCSICRKTVDVEFNGIGEGEGLCICSDCFPEFEKNNYQVVA